MLTRNLIHRGGTYRHRFPWRTSVTGPHVSIATRCTRAWRTGRLPAAAWSDRNAGPR